MEIRNLLNEVMPDVEKYVIQNGENIGISKEHGYIKDVLLLYGKQHNLIESTLLLLDNNHNEEAYVLYRDILNTYFLIGYLLNDKDGSRLKEYRIQPAISDRYFWENSEQIMKRSMFKKYKELGNKIPYTDEEIKENLKQAKSKIEAAGFETDRRPLSIRRLAKNCDKFNGLETYAINYAKASKFAHCDINTLSIYTTEIPELETALNKNEIMEYVGTKDNIFKLDINKTDECLKKEIYLMISIIYFCTFMKFTETLTRRRIKLIKLYNHEALTKITSKMLKLEDLLEKAIEDLI